MILEALIAGRMQSQPSGSTPKYPEELRERAVRMVFEVRGQDGAPGLALGSRYHCLTPPAGAVAGAMAEVVEAGLPEMKGRQEFYGLVVADLNASGLFAAELSGVLGTAALMRPLTNRIGRQFVEFISPPA